MTDGKLYRYSAFSDRADGGNPAGVWVGDAFPDPEEMQRIAAEVGYSETAFVTPARGLTRSIRYYSPLGEVTFCGHATIATGVVLGETEGDATFLLSTTIGEVPVTVQSTNGRPEAALLSVEPRHETAPAGLVAEVLAALDWAHDDLDGDIPPANAYAGAWHLVLAAASAARLATLDYDFEGLKTIMTAAGLTTVQLIWRESPNLYHSRNPFPVGGVVEDPATGAAAAALGGYLRDAKLITPPASVTIRQGEAMGRPSILTVEIPTSGGIIVKGTAVPIAS